MAPARVRPRWLAAAILISLALTALAPAHAADPDLIDIDEDLLSASRKTAELVVSLYRMLHQIPELLYDLNKTGIAVRSVLDDMGIEYRYPVAKSGVVATIGSGMPIIGLRADMDALPIQEPEGLLHRSKSPGKMHACGHDAHMAMLLAAASLLKQRESRLKGTVRLVFQPAEEGGHGGQLMVEEGAVDRMSMMFALHVWPTLTSGVVGSRAGTITAGSAFFFVNITGRGGHAAMPHLNIDPWPATGEIISSLQTIVSRETDPVESNVVSVAWVKGGEACNVIPDVVRLGGTIRSLQQGGIEWLQNRVSEIAKSIGAAHGCTVDIRFNKFYPPTVNDRKAHEFGVEVISSLLGKEGFDEQPPSLVGEDFAYYGHKVPSAWMVLGIRNASAGSVHLLHSPKFVMDESALPTGAALYASLALQYLERHGGTMPKDEL